MINSFFIQSSHFPDVPQARVSSGKSCSYGIAVIEMVKFVNWCISIITARFPDDTSKPFVAALQVQAFMGKLWPTPATS